MAHPFHQDPQLPEREGQGLPQQIKSRKSWQCVHVSVYWYVLMHQKPTEMLPLCVRYDGPKPEPSFVLTALFCALVAPHSG